MKKSVIIILLFFISGICAFAAGMRDILTSMENNILGYDRNNESDSARIERLEEYVYGSKKTGLLQTRLEALQNDTGFTYQVNAPKKEQMMQQNMQNMQSMQGAQNSGNYQAQKGMPQLNKALQKPASAPKENDTVEYTAVDKMEKELFKKTYKNENIYDRLNRLEKAVFQKTSSADLNTRVDKLSEVLRPKVKKTPNYDNYTAEEIQSLYNNGSMQRIDNQEVPFQLALLENSIFNRDYSSDNNAERLSRLEQKVLQRTFPNDSDLQRVQRLSAVYEAKKNSHAYENNRKMQNMAVISQIGGILLMILAILL